MYLPLKDILGPLITWNSVFQDGIALYMVYQHLEHSLKRRYKCYNWGQRDCPFLLSCTAFCAAFFTQRWPQTSPNLTTVNSHMQVSREDKIWQVTFSYWGSTRHSTTAPILLALPGFSTFTHKAIPGWDRSLTEQPWAVSWLLEESHNQPRLCQTKTLIL